ncbi:CRISPR-associated helicase Cas3' [Alkaliphilus sp. MSJ-5]|uniref:CRISPR-associated helicase Cas3 n=1 Tax=Alkaliphilus flagellatus TaxID=2841507 RepID=A0ABS6G511_9FIRM|nr:CRISPR-associated helicase Cas3' [Alkaliphilus flagellatus]MBU5677231.1 CRISPR-associated helicase Cas3' [Alkaliphilus flagellatus]
MYFEKVEKFDFEKFILNHKKIYAHIWEDRKETLQEHSDLSTYYLQKIIKVKQLDNVLHNFQNIFLKEITDEGKSIYWDMFYNTICMHDLGKINCNYQYHKMRNEEFKNKKGLECNNTKHSMLSSLIYINYYFNIIRNHSNKEDRAILCMFMLLNAYVISKHHGALDKFSEFEEKMLGDGGEGLYLYTDQLCIFEEVYNTPILFTKDNNILETLFKNTKNILINMEKREKEISFYIYIYERFLISLLLSCDYYATSHFKNQKEVTNFGEINNIEKFYKIYKDTDIYKGIRKYQEKEYGKISNFDNIKDINIMRNELFLDAENTLLKNMDKNIFYLEAPTGSGKSNVSFNLAFKMVEEFQNINKIFYIYPFNTLIEQNINTLNKIFKNSEVENEIAVINSIVPIKTQINLDDNEDSDVINKENKDYVTSLLDRQFLHYPIILTTHVSIFNYFFGTSKENLFPLPQIANSVIILDEIQSYRNDIWKEIITFLKNYSEILNIKIIIMSATLPNLDTLVDTEVKTINLIENRQKYFNNRIFKDRVELDFSLLDVTEDVLDILLDHVVENSKKKDINILVEFIKKTTAMDFFKRLNEYRLKGDGKFNKQIRLITGDDNSIERNKIIEEIRHNKNIILVATQVIEAGVDIDMDIGYKDISMLDSEEQFLGRINRSCKMTNGGIVYFFNLDNAAAVYLKDIRKEKNITVLADNIRDILINKDFSTYYEYVLDYLNKQSKKNTDKNFDEFIDEYINKLNFKEVEKRMKLIDEDYEYSVFLSRKIEMLDGTILDGGEIWDEYVGLLENGKMEYSERKVKLSEVQSKLNYFIYKVKRNDFIHEKNIGDLYYISDGDVYFTDGKFDRENFDKGIGAFV